MGSTATKKRKQLNRRLRDGHRPPPATRSTSLLYRDLLADPTWDRMRQFANSAAADKGEWAGAPTPVDHVRLVMEPRYPFQKLNGAKFANQHIDKEEPAGNDDSYTLLNQWYSYHRNATVAVCREANGKSRAYLMPEGSGRRFQFWFNTFAVAAQHVWTPETEARAVQKLTELVTAQAIQCYLLTGSFLETSPRSKVTYLFRKLRPTLALRPDRNNNMQCLTALCLHPLGYYEQSWAGVMTPTDDVIAHLMLMRGDEHGFWRKANHHPMWAASAGI